MRQLAKCVCEISYFLKADVELRKLTGHQQSLDSALSLLNQCCSDQKLSAYNIALRLDRLTGQNLFVPLFIEVSSSTAVPDFESVYRELGIDIHNGQTELRENAALLLARQEIVTNKYR